MQETGKSHYSEAVSKAGEAYDKLQEVLGKLTELEVQLKDTIQTRLHTQKPEKLEALRIEIGRLNEQILFFDAEKERLAAQVKGQMEEHKRGQALMDEAQPKRVN